VAGACRKPLTARKKRLQLRKFQEILKEVNESANLPLPLDDRLRAARDEFVSQWGVIGNAWGINRTMAQIHALLITSPVALSTDEVMEELRISRGNANTNLRDLVGWGLVRSVVRKGERKEYFEAEKDVWKMFCIIARERKRREIAPAIEVLDRCHAQTRDLASGPAKTFTGQMKELGDFLRLADTLLEKIAASEESRIIALARKLL
jgi:DNA-binding transcriptional regulator GbsR (MarR family)